MQTSWLPEVNKTQPVHDLLGFFMGFRKDQPVADYTDNILLRGGRNLHQGTHSGFPKPRGLSSLVGAACAVGSLFACLCGHARAC